MTVTEGHIAIFVNDITSAEHIEKYGDFGDNARDLLLRNGCTFPIKKYQVAFDKSKDYTKELENVYQELELNCKAGQIKGVVLTGSATDLFADIPWVNRLDQFIKNYLMRSSKIPTVGICFGHQIIAKNLGCKVAKNLPEMGYEVGTTPVKLNQEIFKLDDSPFTEAFVKDGKNFENLNISEFHFDIVYDLPPKSTCDELNTEFINIGTTSKCGIQGIVTSSGDFKLLSFQGHPEFTADISFALIKQDLAKNLISEKQYLESMEAIENIPNHGENIGRAIFEFIKIHST